MNRRISYNMSHADIIYLKRLELKIEEVFN